MASSFFFVPSPAARGFGAFLGRCFGFFFSLIFLGGGSLVLYKTLEPWGMWISARHWVPVTATVEKSRLASEKDSDGDSSYWIDVVYRYEAGGREYTGERYGFDRDSGNIGVAFKRQEVRRLAPGTKVIAWVNPKKPEEAVLERKMVSFGLIGFFFSLPFLAVGVTGTVATLFGPAFLRWHDARRKAFLRRLREEGRIALREDAGSPEGEEPLPARVIFARDERLKAAGGVTFVNFFWNGIVTVFLIIAFTEVTRGSKVTALGLGLFLIPFVMIGAWMLIEAVRAWRNFFRPNWLAVLDPVPGFEGGETAVSFVTLPVSVRGVSPVRRVWLVAFAGRFDENGNPQKGGDPFNRLRRKKEGEPRELQAIEMPVEGEGLCVTAAYDAVPDAPPPGSRGKEERFWGRWWELQVEHPDGRVERFDAFG